jgi:hypothetical protein
MSKEHLFSDWISTYIPKSATVHSQANVTITFDHDQITAVPNSYRVKQGDIASRKLRVVSVQCNNTWMASLDERVSKILGPMILGASKILCEDDQRLLCAWFAMKAMIASQVYPQSCGIIRAEYEKFYEAAKTKQIPNLPQHWAVWLGYYGDEPGRKRHRQSGIGIPSLADSGPDYEYAAHCEYFVIGRVVAFIAGSYRAYVRFKEPEILSRQLRMIGPNRKGELHWSPQLAVTRGELQEIETKFAYGVIFV